MYILELSGEDDEFAIAEAQNATTNAKIIAPGLAICENISIDRIPHLAYTHSISTFLSKSKISMPDVINSLNHTHLEENSSIAIRARDVHRSTGIDTQKVEKEVGQTFVNNGFSVDLTNPDYEVKILFSGDICLTGSLIKKTLKGYSSRNPTKKPFFQPGSMGPIEARAIANLAGSRAGSVILDPMCGTGGILIEAALMGSTVYGMDIQKKMVHGARQNLKHYLENNFYILQGDATNIPLKGEFDSVMFDIPYGRQSKIAAPSQTKLVEKTLTEAFSLTNKVILISNIPLEKLIRKTGWDLSNYFPRKVHNSLTRYVHILENS